MIIGYSHTFFGDVSFVLGLVCLIIVGITLGSVLTLFSLLVHIYINPHSLFIFYYLFTLLFYSTNIYKLLKCAGTVLSGKAK